MGPARPEKTTAIRSQVHVRPAAPAPARLLAAALIAALIVLLAVAP